MVKRPFPVRKKGKRRTRMLSEYGKELKEKQKLKNLYNLRETQFRKYVKEVLSSRGRGQKDTANLLIGILESRLDNVIFRLGMAPSRLGARQMVSHNHFSVDGKRVNIPSFQVKKGAIIKITSKSLPKKIFQNISARLKKQNIPSWLELDADKLEGKIIREPSFEDAALSIEISAIFEYYSR